MKFRAVIFMDCSFLLRIEFHFFKKHINIGALVFLTSGRQRMLSCCWHIRIQSRTCSKMAPLWNSAISKQTAVIFLLTAHMRSYASAPSCCTRDYPRVAGCCLSFPPMKQKHEGQMAKTSPPLLKAQPTFAGQGLFPVLAPKVTPCPWLHCSEAFVHRRPVGPLGSRGPPAPSGCGSASSPPQGSPQTERIGCGTLAPAHGKRGEGSSDCASPSAGILGLCPPKHSADPWVQL